MVTLARHAFNDSLQGRAIDVNQAQTESPELGAAAQAADLDADGVVAGHEIDQLFLEIDKFDNDGSYLSIRADTPAGPTKAGALAAAAVRISVLDVRTPGPTGPGVVSWSPQPTAMAAARASGPGRKVLERAGLYADVYRAAERHTGVPAAFLLALHANESAMGTWRASTHGPESGFGLDDRWVKSGWANQKLNALGLGNWERGTDTPKSRLQSAVVAAEHLKRQARYAGIITIGPHMNVGDIAGAVTSYVQGISAAKKARRNRRSFMFDLSDANPHPRHPGGTSRTPQGTVRVPASRKAGLLRWDTLLLLADEALATPPPPVS